MGQFQQVEHGVFVSFVLGSAGWAFPMLFPFELVVDGVASVTGLAGGEASAGFDYDGAVPVGLVADLPEQFSDGGVPDGLGLESELVHAGDVEGLDAEDLVLPDQQSADLVVEVFAQSQDFVPDGVDAVLGFEPTSSSFLPAGLLFLPAPELFQVLVEWLWIFVVGQFRIDCEGLDADVGGACFVGFASAPSGGFQ